MKPTQVLHNLFEVVPLAVRGQPVCLSLAFPTATLAAKPGFPAAALPQSGRLASGRGLTAELSRTSALGEAAELVSCCAWGNEELVMARDTMLGPAALAPEALNGFSAAQIGCRHDWNTCYRDFDWRPTERDLDCPMEWLRVEHALGGADAFVPADFVFIGRKQAGDEQAVAIGDSNGCASGIDDDAARVAALLELCERDAAARWWYGRRRRPILDPVSIDGGTGFVDWLRDRERRFFLFDITSDIPVPVVAAVSAEADGSDVVMGFAANSSLRQAALLALTEMVQMEFSLETVRAFGGDAGQWAEWRARVTLATPPLDVVSCRERAIILDNDRPGTLGYLLEACGRAGIPLWFAKMTRDIIGVPAWRAISPALCHTKPRFALPRLMEPDRRDLAPVARNPEAQVPLLI